MTLMPRIISFHISSDVANNHFNKVKAYQNSYDKRYCSTRLSEEVSVEPCDGAGCLAAKCMVCPFSKSTSVKVETKQNTIYNRVNIAPIDENVHEK